MSLNYRYEKLKTLLKEVIPGKKGDKPASFLLQVFLKSYLIPSTTHIPG